MSRPCDLAILGSGPGGYAAAMAASRRGLRVALIERGPIGGVCLNVGCIPTKALIAVAHRWRDVQRAGAYGIRIAGAELDFAAVMVRAQRIVGTLRQGLTGLLRRQGIEILSGEASFEDAHTLRIIHERNTVSLVADRLLVATGASPSPGPWQFDGQRLLSYRDALNLSALPSSLLIIGGGVIGCEFASCFASFGVTVTIVEQQPQILPTEDSEAVRLIVRSLEARGVKWLTGTTVERLEATPAGVRATLATGELLQAERCLIAVGLRPNSHGLGLESLGIETDHGVSVDEFLLTRQRHIAAIGDCLAGHGLAHLASAEGVLAVRNLCEREPERLDSRHVPRCVYTDPELAHVGITEMAAEVSARVSRFSFAALGKALCDEEPEGPEGFVKLIVEAGSERVLGATIVGTHASSLIHVATLAIQHGLTARQLAGSITAHPTWPEAITEAAGQIYGESLSTIGGVRAPRRASVSG